MIKKKTFVSALRTMVKMFDSGSLDEKQLALMFCDLLSLYSRDFWQFDCKNGLPHFSNFTFKNGKLVCLGVDGLDGIGGLVPKEVK